MDRQEELRQWIFLAKQNLDVAKNSAKNMYPMPVETICNQCQQSVEKDLKGYLFLNREEFPKTHDLSELLAMCIDINPNFAKFVKQCTFLTKFAVMPKYPNELQLTDDDAKAAIRFAEEIKEFVVNACAWHSTSITH